MLMTATEKNVMVANTRLAPLLAAMALSLLDPSDACLPAAMAQQPTLATVAERSDYAATATGAEVEVLLRQLASVWPESELTTIGRSVEGRPLWALMVAPKERSESEPVTVLMLGGIHAGECDGKEALLALARDMATGQQGDWWHSLRMIFVPNFNADGNERRGLEHRPGQNGPEGPVGIRENAQGLDLNRDFVKLESPEVRSLVAVLNQYEVDLLIDLHTTNGSLHQYELTYDVPHHPAAPAALVHWLRHILVPNLNQRMEEAGFESFYYGNFDADHRQWRTFGHELRYSTEYMGLRGKIGILGESYSYADYKTRIEASYCFVKEVLSLVAASEQELRQLIDNQGFLPREGINLPIGAELVKTADSVVIKGFQTPSGTPPQRPYGAESRAQNQPHDYNVQLWNSTRTTREISVPNSYAVPQQFAWAAGRLVRHGIQLKQLIGTASVEVDVYEISDVERRAQLEGHDLRQISVEPKQRRVELPPGTWIVETSQPLGWLAACLLEPAADDNLASWNFFDPAIEPGADYPVLRVKNPLHADALRPVSDVAPSEQITLEHLYHPAKSVKYEGRDVRSPKWLQTSSEYVVASDGGSTFAVEAATGARRRLIQLDVLQEKLESLDAFSNSQARNAASVDAFTDDWRHALISHQNELYVFDADSESVRQVTHSPEQKEQLPELSPQGEHVAFVCDNDLFVANCETTELKQLTHDGSTEILNGILDWVYQEELYGRGNFKAFWWSPDGKRIAFLRLDQSQVPAYQVSDSTSFEQSLEFTRYPKVGQNLPEVQVWLANSGTGELKQVDLSQFAPSDRLVGRVTWAPDGALWLQILNRVQNRQDVVRVDPLFGIANVLFTEISPGWIEIRGTPHFLPDGDFLWLSDLPQGRTHLFRVSAKSGERSQLTRGDWDVAELLSVSSDQKTAFLTGNISDPIEQHLVAVDVRSGTARQVTYAPGTHRPLVDGAGEYFIDVFSSLDSPPLASLHSIDGQMIRVLDAPTSDRYQYLDIQPPKSFTISARDGRQLQSQLILPPGYTYSASPESQETAAQRLPRLPVIFYVYGGPQAPTVSNAWAGRNYWWHQLLCQQGFAVLLCDNRSARGQGIRDTWTIRGDLARQEMQDLEDAVSWIKQQPWADPERLGIWGWSYGGYFTAYAMTHSQHFRCGIAGAPVTDWRNYDAIYTERYMDLLDANESGYSSSSVVQAASELHGRLLIIHGERDDNVHLSNTLQLAYALQKAGKQFDLMLYPKNRHAIVDPEQRYHMYEMMTDFFKQHLQANDRPSE
jgi:dipeptidyl-peptidase 4